MPFCLVRILQRRQEFYLSDLCPVLVVSSYWLADSTLFHIGVAVSKRTCDVLFFWVGGGGCFLVMFIPSRQLGAFWLVDYCRVCKLWPAHPNEHRGTAVQENAVSFRKTRIHLWKKHGKTECVLWILHVRLLWTLMNCGCESSVDRLILKFIFTVPVGNKAD